MHCSTSLDVPSRVRWNIRTSTRAPPAARSIAPPTPPTPGDTLQLARSPRSESCKPPRTIVVTRPLRAMANASLVSKKLAPGSRLTKWPLAL